MSAETKAKPDLPTIPSEEEDALTRADPIRPGPILARLALTLLGVLVGMAVVDRAILAVDASQGADGGTGAIMQVQGLGWTNKPFFENPEFETRLDRFGLRNDEIPQTASPAELRIAGFGASRVFGAGGGMQPWCWNYQLEQQLEESDVRVLNGGVMGYSGLQAARRARLFLDALEPDLVFVLVSPGRQMMVDNSSALNWVQIGDDPENLVPADVVEGLPELLQGPAIWIHRLGNAYSGIYRRLRANVDVGNERGAEIAMWRLTTSPMSASIAESVERTLLEFEALAETCDRRGIELRALVFPDIEQDSELAWQGFVRNNQAQGAPPIGTPREEPSRELQRRLEEHGLQVWNFYEEVSRMGTSRKSYIMKDNFHWSEPGHQVFARGLARRMREEGLLESLAARRSANPRTRPFGEVPFENPEETTP